jgi:hypothetical protein
MATAGLGWLTAALLLCICSLQPHAQAFCCCGCGNIWRLCWRHDWGCNAGCRGGLGAYGMPYGAGGAAAAAAGAAVAQPAQAAQAAAGHDRPRFLPGGGVAMLLCDVALGRPGNVSAGSRRPEAGYHSAGMSSIHAVYQNDQASGAAA